MQKLIIDFECNDKSKEEEAKSLIQESIFNIMNEYGASLRHYSAVSLFPIPIKSETDIKKELNIPDFLKRKLQS